MRQSVTPAVLDDAKLFEIARYAGLRRRDPGTLKQGAQPLLCANRLGTNQTENLLLALVFVQLSCKTLDLYASYLHNQCIDA
jgi:hypothetical protein